MGAVNNNQIRKTKSFIFASVFIGAILGCSNQKYSQCQQLIAIANATNDKAQQITKSSSEQINLKTWLEASAIMATASQNIENLPTKDLELLNYQKNLAKVFKIYSQAIYDAVQARENKNLSELKIARKNAQEAEQLNQTLVAQINSYCSLK